MVIELLESILTVSIAHNSQQCVIVIGMIKSSAMTE